MRISTYESPGSPSIDWFCLTGDIPDSAVRIAILDDKKNMVYEQAKASSLGSLDGAVTAAAAEPLGGSIRLTWDGTKGRVYRWVRFSSDGGQTWVTGNLPLLGDSFEYATDFLPASNRISVQIISSDGLQQAVEQIDGLRMENRAPQVTVLIPPDGAAIPPGASLDLFAEAFDAEDGPLTGGVWRSSRDGKLGNGAFLPGVHLSAGAHTLTYEIADSAGKSAAAQAQITVQPVNAVDLALNTDSLKFYPAARDPIMAPAVNLTLGITHSLVLEVQGASVPMEATVVLFVTPPGGSETRIARERLALDVFGSGRLVADIVPSKAGDYRVRGAITAASMPDPDQAAAGHRLWLPQLRR